MPNELQVGDLVAFRDGARGGVGVVTSPISAQTPGHVLTLHGDELVGVPTTLEDVYLAAERHEGFAQLAYHLIKLGSHVIEGRLIGMLGPRLDGQDL